MKPRKPLTPPPPVKEDDIFSTDNPVLEIDRRAPRRPSRLSLPTRYTVLLTDLLLCLLLDASIFYLVLWASRRELTPLINYSLIPLFFVLLTFTILYFVIFRLMFGRTLGEILVGFIRERAKKNGRE